MTKLMSLERQVSRIRVIPLCEEEIEEIKHKLCFDSQSQS